MKLYQTKCILCEQKNKGLKMLKILLSLLFISSLAFSANSKPTGCDLSQVGSVKLSLGSKVVKKANYKAIAKSGKNFHSILVGSVISTQDAVVEILDIKADKRVRGKPRTGTIVVSLDAQQKVKMHYSYSEGHFIAKGVEKNGKKISFALEIAALLCHAK